MLKVMGGAKGVIQLPHAQGEGLDCQLIYDVWGDARSIRPLFLAVVIASVTFIKVL